MLEKALRKGKGGTILRVQVSPGSVKDALAGYDEWRGAVKIKIAAEPIKGKANEALVRFVARSFGIPPDRVEIMAGARGRLKEVILGGMEEESALRKLKEVIGH